MEHSGGSDVPIWSLHKIQTFPLSGAIFSHLLSFEVELLALGNLATKCVVSRVNYRQFVPFFFVGWEIPTSTTTSNMSSELDVGTLMLWTAFGHNLKNCKHLLVNLIYCNTGGGGAAGGVQGSSEHSMVDKMRMITECWLFGGLLLLDEVVVVDDGSGEDATICSMIRAFAAIKRVEVCAIPTHCRH